MSNKLEGKVAVVTGGTTGIGLGIAQEFAAEGATVFITGRRQEELDAAVVTVGHGAIGVKGDVSRLADLDRLYDVVQQRTSQVDVLVANAGGGAFQPLGAITEEEFDETFAINVKGTLFTVQKALPLLADGASVILTSSTSTTRALPAFSVYGATKAAIRNFARHWILDLKDRRVRVNALSPGPIKTPGLQGLTANDEQWRARGRSGRSIPRVGRRELRERRRAVRRRWHGSDLIMPAPVCLELGVRLRIRIVRSCKRHCRIARVSYCGDRALPIG